MLSRNRGSNDASEREPLAGLIERVTFYNPDSGFCVLRVKVKGHHELVTLLGAEPSVAAGEYVQASGIWETIVTTADSFAPGSYRSRRRFLPRARKNIWARA
jgi:hypothetical protein